MPVTTLLFDADGVVQHGQHLSSSLLTELGGDDFWRNAWELELELFTGGEFRPRLADLLRRRGSHVPLERALGLWTAIEVDAEVLDLVRRLRANGYYCALTTNQQQYRAAYMRDNLGYADAFDAQFYSCELGVAKPSPAYFHAVVAALDASARQTLFVDDSPANVAGAREAGLVAEVHDPGTGVDGLRALLERHDVTDEPTPHRP